MKGGTDSAINPGIHSSPPAGALCTCRLGGGRGEEERSLGSALASEAQVQPEVPSTGLPGGFHLRLRPLPPHFIQ